MCGLVAMYSPRRPISENAVASAVQRLQHRGPNSQHHWISPDRRVALGHARLSIIDLATGDQPIANETGDARIVVNGEFYGYEPIQLELQQAGHRLRTRSDSEIALHLYEDLGPQCLHRLRGEFALVLWDESRQTLFAARDRFGIKPLFYAFHNDTLYLASEAKALFAAGVPARWNVNSVWSAPDRGDHRIHTLFDGVFEVPPGHYLLATEKHFQLIPYWDFHYPRLDPGARQRPDAEYAGELRAALDEAVRLRLRADVPVGCYLSGGIDSSALLGLAAQHSSKPIRAFNLSFDHGDYNEEAQAREMAQRTGAQFLSIPVGQDDFADHFADAIEHAETLAENPHGVAKYLLSRAVRDAGCKVVLTGEGSDEIFAGYTSFRRDILLYNNESQDPATATARLQQMEQANPITRGLFQHHGEHVSLEHVKRLLGFVPSWMDSFSASSARLQDLFADSFRTRLAHEPPFRALLSGTDIQGQLAGRAPVHQSMYLWAKSKFPKYLLTMLGDRMEMAHSIEGRVPFLDHHVVNLVASQPVDVKMRGATDKYILREAVRDVVTQTVYRRQKHAFLTPTVTLNPKGNFHALVQDILRGPMLNAVPFFDQRKVIEFLDRLPGLDEGARVAGDLVLMTAVSACVLQSRFNLTA
jgi:asparagine synthase (glutamine-hydrolysing)